MSHFPASSLVSLNNLYRLVNVWNKCLALLHLPNHGNDLRLVKSLAIFQVFLQSVNILCHRRKARVSLWRFRLIEPCQTFFGLQVFLQTFNFLLYFFPFCLITVQSFRIAILPELLNGQLAFVVPVELLKHGDFEFLLQVHLQVGGFVNDFHLELGPGFLSIQSPGIDPPHSEIVFEFFFFRLPVFLVEVFAEGFKALLLGGVGVIELLENKTHECRLNVQILHSWSS